MVISRVISRATILITHIKGPVTLLITTRTPNLQEGLQKHAFSP